MSVVTGFHAIEESLKIADKPGTLYISVKGTRIERLIDAAKSAGVAVHRVSAQSLNELAEGKEHRGAAFITVDAQTARHQDIGDAISRISSATALVVVLDGITDPQNLGAILRSADLFEVDLVVLPSKRSAQLNPTVLKTSAGASNYVSVVTVTNTVRALTKLKEAGFWIYGADASGAPANKVDLTGRICLVMGSEDRGIGRLVREQCDEIIRIPIGGNIDSLNVSVAAGICLYEIRRQQDFRPLQR